MSRSGWGAVGAPGAGARRRRAGRALASAGVAAALLVGAGGLVPAHAGGGGTGEYTASVTITKGGDRTGRSQVSGLAGADFELYRVSDASTITGGTLAGSCTTAADGTCTVRVTARGASYFYARETSAPAGWTAIEEWGRDALLRHNTGRMDSGRSSVTLPGPGRTWPDVRANNSAPAKCGLNLGLVMDTSSSIDDERLAVFRTAARGIVGTLANTPSRISLSRFDDDAAPVLPLTSVASGDGVGRLQDAIASVDGSGWTNWDEALWESVNPDLDVLLFLTDGDPTQNMAGTGNGSVRLRDLEEAVHSANAVKKAGTQLVAVGIGITATGSVKRLNLISSPGNTYTVGWDQLAGRLKELASGQCEGRLTIQKQVRDHDGTPLTSAAEVNGWSFAGSASAGTLGTFAPTSTVNGLPGFTSASLAAPAGSTPTVTLTETLRPGYRFADASCTVDGQQVAVTKDVATGRFSFPGRSGAVMNCVVVNRKQAPPLADLVLTKTASTAYARGYTWALAKDVDSHHFEVGPDGRARATYSVTVTPSVASTGNYTVSGRITVANPNAVAVTGVDVRDSLDHAGCTVADGTGRTVPAQGSIVLDYTCADPAGAPTGTGTNTATATWDASRYPGSSGRATGSAAYDYAAATVTTTHGRALVTDSMVDIDGTGGNGVVLEAADGPRTFTYTRELTAPAGECREHVNTATVQPLGAGGRTGSTAASDSETVTVCAEAEPVVAVTAGGDLARGHAWSIEKQADATERTVDPATGTATFRYTVTVRAGAATTTAGKVAGTVTVRNPNTYPEGALSGTVSLSETFGGGAVCTLADGAALTLAPGRSAELAYACTFASTPAQQGSVTATFGWDPAGGATAATVTGAAQATLGVSAETDKVVDVVDDQTVPGRRVVLAEDLVWEPGLVRTYTYDLAVAGGAPGSCAAWTNTASVDLTSGADPGAQSTVRACTPEVLPVQSYGRATGSVRASCQGTVTAALRNESGATVRYTLRVGARTKQVSLASLDARKVQLRGPAGARVRLKIGSKVLDRARVPKRCTPPEELPHTGVRTEVAARVAALVHWLG